MVKTPEQQARGLAEAHWTFQERWLRMVFIDSFIHGFRHGAEWQKQALKEKHEGPLGAGGDR